MFSLLSSIGRFRRKHIAACCTLKSVLLLKCSRFQSTTNWRVLFYGTDQLSECTLIALDKNRLSGSECKVVKSLDVVCKQSDCAVRRYAASKNLIIHSWPFDVPSDMYDIGIVVSFGHMIPSSSIFACKYGIINAHPSLLPRWRGAAPILYSILQGDEETGVTITQVSPNKFDVGNILMQEPYPIPPRCTAKTLTRDLGQLAANMVLKTLENLPYYLEKSYPQPKEGITLARKIKPQLCYINWEEDTAVVIDRKFRAFFGFFDLFTLWKGLKIIILDLVPPEEVDKAKISELVSDPVPAGYCYFHKKRKILFVKCKDGWIGIKQVKVPKRGKITALDFYNGFISKEDPSNCCFTTVSSLNEGKYMLLEMKKREIYCEAYKDIIQNSEASNSCNTIPCLTKKMQKFEHCCEHYKLE